MPIKVYIYLRRASRWDSICVPWASDLFGKPSDFSKIQSQLKWDSILVDKRDYTEIGKNYAVRINTFHQIYWATVFSSSLPKGEFLYLRRIPLLAFWKKLSVHYHQFLKDNSKEKHECSWSLFACGLTSREGAASTQAKWIKLDLDIA